MPESGKLLQTVEALHAAGLGAQPWQDALATMAGLFDSQAVTLERFDVTSGCLREYHAFGVPPAHEIEYLAEYATRNPRAAFGMRHPKLTLQWDYQFIDEAGMGRDPYYADFLPRVGLRYYICAQLLRTTDEMVVVAVQRTLKQGHVGAPHIDLMETLLPHLRQALDMAKRLKHAAGNDRSLKAALDWLADGVALIRADGTILYANDALQAIARRGDGLRISKGAFVFPTSENRARFAMATAAIVRLHAGDAATAGSTDLAVSRGAGMPPYLLSMRPLLPAEQNGDVDRRAVAIVFVRDPLSRNPAANEVLREVFGLTRAEADVARALQAGMSAAQYAREHDVSLNTVYTHLRRIKEKMRCNRIGELLGKLNDLQVPLRID